MRNVLWSDDDVRTWAELYVEKAATLEQLEDTLKVSHSTLWWCFMNRLPAIDSGLAQEVYHRISLNRHSSKWHKRGNF